jgi:glycosyltransferase involved in cell wall biosynthesis
MRILICHRFGRLLGGIETYLQQVIPALVESHDVALLFENDLPAAHQPLPLSDKAWFTSDMGTSQSLLRVVAWRPDIIYVHTMSDPDFEQALVGIAPAVKFAHDYSATCISGTKTLAFPHADRCLRRLGPECLVNYFPRRCGGISPITMWRDYRSHLARLHAMRQYRFVLVASDAMRQEYMRNGFQPSQLLIVRYPVAVLTEMGGVRPGHCLKVAHGGVDADALHLLFAGRMVRWKGGEVLLGALPQITESLQRRVKLTLAGEGPAKARWEAQARVLCAQNPLITIEFSGWLQQADLQKLMRSCDLLVIPSLWPEPFGLVGLEAGMVGLPAAAFATGGIPEWLEDGINGFLAPANPPSAVGLAAAITKCVVDPSLHRQLREGAQRRAMRFNLPGHLKRLLDIFIQAVERDAYRIGHGGNLDFNDGEALSAANAR